MSRIPQSFIDDLLSRLDIVDVVDRRVKLKRAGKNYSACCPFHDEKTPSFTVSPDKQFYYCFGCGASGNAIGFLMEYERQGFVDAVESLASHAGVQVPKEQQPEHVEQNTKQRKQLYDITEKASLYYEQQLKSHPQRLPSINYLKNRGLTGVIAKQFSIGLSPNNWDNLLTKLGQNELDRKLLIQAGLVINKEEENKTYDRFRNRIMFPIRDVRGRTIGFGGRVLGDEKPKYLNSPETDIFHKSKELYGLFEARNANRQLDSIMVVEGYMDVIALAQFGITNAVATLGTACGEDHLKLAFRFTSEITFCFDGDKAGRNAAKRALTNSLSSMHDGRQIKFLFLPEGQDPDSLVRQIGPDRFKGMTQNALPLEEFLFDVAAENIDINSMDGRARFSKIAAPLVAQIPEGVYRELMFNNLAKRTGLTSEQLRELQHEKVLIHEEPTATEVTLPSRPPEEITSATQPPPPILLEKIKKSAVNLTPARIATILLLENPQLAKEQNDKYTFLNDTKDPEIKRLAEIFSFLKRRPESNFNKIMGFWAGKYGIDAQQALTQLVANQCFGSVKSIKSYNPNVEFKQALAKLDRIHNESLASNELSQLSTLPYDELTSEQRTRLLELISVHKTH